MHFPLLTTLSLSLISFFLSPASALPLNNRAPTEADDCHQGVYCGSYDGQAALVSPLPISPSSLILEVSWLRLFKLYCNSHAPFMTCRFSCYIDQSCVPYTIGWCWKRNGREGVRLLQWWLSALHEIRGLLENENESVSNNRVFAEEAFWRLDVTVLKLLCLR